MADHFYGTEHQTQPVTPAAQPVGKTGKFVNYAGAAVSFALIVGVGVWGYKLLVRDVTGVPVVAAIDGPMRTAPEDPGGSQAAHQGLAVNNVAAEGEAAAPEDRLVLAPRPVELQAEDTPVMRMAEAGEVAPVETPPEETVAAAVNLDEPADPVEPLDADDVLALAERIAANVEPLTPLAPAAEPQPEPVVQASAGAISPAIPGVARSYRPNVRPAALNVARPVTSPVTSSSTALSSDAIEVSAASISAGTRLVQLGAYDSADVARVEWTKIAGRFGEYMEGKQRVIQQASIGGKTFFRLRVLGFADLSDARRFCSALVAENAACIPVVAR